MMPTEKIVSEEKLAYPVCDGWFSEFYIHAQSWLYYESFIDDDWIDPVHHNHGEFDMGPMCNHHQSGVYLSRPYWEAMVKMFGHSPELGVLSYDPDAVEPELVTYPMNTMTTYEPDAEGDCCDIMETILLSKSLTIKPVDSC